ncbi:MAG TPA: response regulator [Anaerolineales bacterium]|nr:response regulator [Anaerolineales bacterium]
MTSPLQRERILAVDEDPQVLDLLARQVLEPLGYLVATADEAGRAIEQAINFSPDLILASLTLPGLTGKDLLVALRSQGMEVPVLVMAGQGMEADAIQAFRLGARDYLVKPLREAEVVAALEHALNEVRLRRERTQLAEQLAESNRQLERRVRELTTIYGIGKVVTSTTDQGQLFNKLMEGSLYVTEADMGWMLLAQEGTEQLILRAQRNLPPSVAANLLQPWNDGVSSLVMLSGQALSIHGEGLSQFKLARLCRAALIAPIKVRDQPIGVICVSRQKLRPFSERDQAMLEAVADYASISLVNSRLFQALETRAQRLQQAVEKSRGRLEPATGPLNEIAIGLQAARDQLALISSEAGNPALRAKVAAIQDLLDAQLRRLARNPGSPPTGEPPSAPPASAQ